MPDIAKCLNEKVERGLLSREQAEEALKVVRRFETKHSALMNRTSAEARAAADAAAELERKTKKKIQQAERHIIATKRALDAAKAHPKGTAAGVAALFARDIWQEAGGVSLEYRIRAVRDQLRMAWSAGLAKYRTTFFGMVGNAAAMRDFVKAAYGETVADADAASNARAWERVTDSAVDRFNAAGGDLANKKNWRLPSFWDAERLKNRRDEFIAWMSDAFHKGEVTVWNHDEGRPASWFEFSAILGDAWESISTNGLSDMIPGQAGKKALGNSLADLHRVFQFETADAWLRANDKWGVGDAGIYGLMNGHLSRMGRDIAMLEAFGPNPDHVARILIDTAEREGVSGWKANRLSTIYEYATERALSPVSALISNLGTGLRGWLTGSKMGSAILSAPSDFATMRMTAKWNGLDQTKIMKSYLRGLANNPERAKLIAARTGLIAETWMQAGRTLLRDAFDDHATGLRVGGGNFLTRLLGRNSERFAAAGGKAAELVIRAQGLAHHTNQLRIAFGLEFYGALADLASKKLADLPAEFQRGFKNYGITEADWDAIRSTGLGDLDGIKMIVPEQLVKAGAAEAESATKLMGLIAAETDFAVIQPGALERSALLGSNKPGTVKGELLRSLWLFKSFPVTMMTTHGIRSFLDLQKNGIGIGSYAVHFAIATTLMGALSEQMRAVANGKDPLDMLTGSFWATSFSRGGGAGILGDLIYAGFNKTNQGFFTQFFGGPVAQFANDVVALTGNNMQAAAAGQDTGMGRELARFVRSYTPGSNLWYSRLATDRLIFDQLQMMLDRKYPQAFRRLEQRAAENYGQKFWWRPGKASPDRGPNFAAAAGAKR